jgi:hypothetical protein
MLAIRAAWVRVANDLHVSLPYERIVAWVRKNKEVQAENTVSTSANHNEKIDRLRNDEIAQRFDEVAELLVAQKANPFRIQAYRNAAETVRQLSEPLQRLVEESGKAGLLELPGIGESFATAIEQLLKTGKLPVLERLRSDYAPERALRSVPFVGRQLARRIHEQLKIETLGELEQAAWDGRLAQVPGMGHKRIESIRDSLAGRFRSLTSRAKTARHPPSNARPLDSNAPRVADLLAIDREYREKAEQDRLPRIAPRRFNPEGKAWLPILRTKREDQRYTAFFSNTAHAHELGMTHDWVVICRNDGDRGQWTVITAWLGKLKGKRVVRGRESECQEYYANLSGSRMLFARS